MLLAKSGNDARLIELTIQLKQSAVSHAKFQYQPRRDHEANGGTDNSHEESRPRSNVIELRRVADFCQRKEHSENGILDS